MLYRWQGPGKSPARLILAEAPAYCEIEAAYRANSVGPEVSLHPWFIDQVRIAAWSADNGRAYRESVANSIKDTAIVFQSNFFNPPHSRGLTQMQSHAQNHVIIPKDAGFVVSAI